jgi:hypothetical protein
MSKNKSLDCTVFNKTKVSSVEIITPPKLLLENLTVDKSPLPENNDFFKGNTNEFHANDKESLKLLSRVINGGDLAVEIKDA